MNRALLTINFNHALCENSRASMQASATRWGATFWEINENSGVHFPMSPHAYKCAVFERSAYDEVLILDADMIVSEKCANPFEVFGGIQDLVAVANGSARFGDLSQIKGAEKYEVDRLMSRDPQFAQVRYSPARYFNTGMMFAKREFHAALFKLALDVCHVDHGLGWVDQTPLNLAALKCNVPVLLAHERWNYIHPSVLGPGWEDLTTKDVYIAHFAGETGREQVIPKVKWKFNE